MEWEYDIQYIEADRWTYTEPAEILNSQGSVGWELVAVHTITFFGEPHCALIFQTSEG
jgi:hypothetical protein